MLGSVKGWNARAQSEGQGKQWLTLLAGLRSWWLLALNIYDCQVETHCGELRSTDRPPPPFE